MRCFATLSMTRQEIIHRCHAERSEAESKHLIPWGLCVTSLTHPPNTFLTLCNAATKASISARVL